MVFHRTYFPCMLGAACLVASFVAAQDRSGGREHSLAAGFNSCVKTLGDEARQSMQTGQLARADRTFAAEYGGGLPPEILNEKITRPLDSDPFIDAYIRWQLTAFKPSIAGLKEREFEQMLDDLPRLVPNPRADVDLIKALQEAVQAGQLSVAQQQSLNESLNDLAGRSSAAMSLNQPALQFRDWLREQLPKTGPRALLAELERCAALVEAGWPVDDQKAKVDELFAASARNRSFEEADRTVVTKHMSSLAGRKRLIIASAGIRENAAAAEFTDTGIYDFDVMRWAKMIE